jgi:ATP-dependent Clp protease ATP-binding subunit ClpC
MNDAVLLKLRVIVERAVRPVRASLARKKKMREELLAHVTGVFEDELPRSPDEATALNQVESRFGDPDELSQRLQESIPKRDCFAYLVERLIEPRAGESLVRRAARYGAMLFAVDATLSVVLPLLIFPLIGKTRELGLAIYFLVLFSFAFGMATFAATILTYWLMRTLFNTPQRSYFKASVAVIFSSLLPFFIPWFFSVGTYLLESESASHSFPALWVALPVALLAPAGFIGMAKLITDELRYREEWSKLQID